VALLDQASRQAEGQGHVASRPGVHPDVLEPARRDLCARSGVLKLP
jgi:hypothetical protein